MNITFHENVKGGIGALIIHGLKVPHASYEPLGKIWSSVKKRISEWYGVDVAGLFTYDDDKCVISANFCLNYGAAELESIDQKIYTKRFEDTFGRQMGLFEEVIDAFANNPEGLTAYKALVLKGAGKKEIEQQLNEFLISVGVKNASKKP